MRSRKILYLMFLPCILCAESSQWTATADTNWQNPVNWSNGVPGITTGANNPDLEAVLTFPPFNSPNMVNLTDPVTLNTITFINSNYSLSGSALTLGGGSQAVNGTINNAVAQFNNPLIVQGSGIIQLENSSEVTIANGFQCTNSNITFNNSNSIVNCSSDATFNNSTWLYSSGGQIDTFNNISSELSTLSFGGQSITINSGDFQNKSKFTINSLAAINTIMSDNSSVTFSNAQSSSVTMQNQSDLSVVGNNLRSTINDITSNHSTTSISNNAFLASTNVTLNNHSTLTINNATLSVTNLSFNDSLLNMSLGNFTASGNISMTNSKGTLANSNIVGAGISDTSLINSSLTLTSNSSYTVIFFSMDSNSIINLKDSQFLYLGESTIQPSIVNFILTKEFIDGSYFVSDSSNIDLLNAKGTITLSGSLPAGGQTFFLFNTLKPYVNTNLNPDSFTLPSSSSNVIWHGPTLLASADGRAVIVTADVQHSPSTTIRSVMSTTSQVTLATVKQLENVKQNARAGDQTYLTSNFSKQNDSYFAQNSVIAQATPVEQLSERGVYRPYHQWSVYVAPLGSVGSIDSKDDQPISIQRDSLQDLTG